MTSRRRIPVTGHTLAAAVALLALLATGHAAVAGKDAAQAFAGHTLSTLDGKKVAFSSFKGEVVVVNFWASWCAPCRRELSVMDEWNAGWSGKGARVVAISIDKELRNARRFARENELSLGLFHDGPSGLAKTLDLPSVPCTYLLDGNGKVITMIRGSSDKDLAKIESQVETLLATSRVTKVQKAGAARGDTP